MLISNISPGPRSHGHGSSSSLINNIVDLSQKPDRSPAVSFTLADAQSAFSRPSVSSSSSLLARVKSPLYEATPSFKRVRTLSDGGSGQFRTHGSGPGPTIDPSRSRHTSSSQKSKSVSNSHHRLVIVENGRKFLT